MSYRNSYADGVPLYLSKKYYPVPKSKYKEVDCHIPLDALQEGYDFTLERQAISEFEQYEKEKEFRKKYEDEVKIRRERRRKEAEEAVAAKAEAAAAKAAALVREYEEEIAKQTKGGRELGGVLSPKGALSEVLESPEDFCAGSKNVQNAAGGGVEEPVIPSDSSTPSESVTYSDKSVIQDINNETRGYPTEAGVTYAVHRDNYLPPPPAAPPPSSSYQQEPLRPYEPPKYVPLARIIPATSINLSDFESDTANPFDNVELKSINDMALLATILQNNCTVPTTSTNNLNNGQNQQIRAPNVNVNLNGIVHPQHQHHQQQQQQHHHGVNYFPYLSQNSNNPAPYPSPHHPVWTPTSHNPFYTPYSASIMVTASSSPDTSSSSAAPTSSTSAIGTSSSADSLQQQQSASTNVPIHRPSPQMEPTSSSPQTIPSTLQLHQGNPSGQSAENFANFYFPFTSSQSAQSRLKNPTDREFS